MAVVRTLLRSALVMALSLCPALASSDHGLQISFGKLEIQVRHYMGDPGPHAAQVSASHLLFELLAFLESNEDLFSQTELELTFWIGSSEEESMAATTLTLTASKGTQDVLDWTRPLQEHLCPQIIEGLLEAMGCPKVTLKRSSKIRLSRMKRGKDDNANLRLPRGALGRVFLGPLPGFYDHWAIPRSTSKAEVVVTRDDVELFFRSVYPPWDQRVLNPSRGMGTKK